MIAEARHIARCHEAMRNKTIGIARERWRQTINELYGKKLGIIGFGSIGKEVAIRAKAFGMNIIVYDPYVSEEDVKNLGGSKVDLETLLKEADFITLHAKFINTSRGAIVDEQALYEALKARRIAGAALDVYEQEPFSLDNPILQLDNVTVTPHLAGTSSEVPMRTVELAVKKIADFISGKKLSPTDIVNPSILKD
jgi:D-3-phosphoglycerate dehydrogenase